MRTLRDWVVFYLGTVLSLALAVLIFVLAWTPWDRALRALWRTRKGR